MMQLKRAFIAVTVVVIYLLLFAVVDQLTSAFISTGIAKYVTTAVVISATVLTYDFMIRLSEKKKKR